MRKKFTVLVFILLLPLSIWAQDTIRHIICSEVRFSGWEAVYVEFTNMGDSAVDLSNFFWGNERGGFVWEKVGDEVVWTTPSVQSLEDDTKFMRLEGVLEPGESTCAMYCGDELNPPFDWSKTPPGFQRHPLGLIERSSMFIYGLDSNPNDEKIFPYYPELKMFGFDSISTNSLCLNHRPTNESGTLFWVSGDSIAVLVDQFALEVDWADDQKRVSGYITVAGVPEAVTEFNFVRRFSVKEGETDWDKAVGDVAENSQWMLYPHMDGRGAMVRETEGYHGEYSIDVSSDVCTIGDGTISVPWGAQKEDSLRTLLTLGKGMAWWYRENGNFEDSLSNVCQDGDTLELYGFGTNLDFKQYVISVEDPVDDMVEVFAKHAIAYPDPEDEDYSPTQIPVRGGIPYRILVGLGDAIDSIGQIPYATKVDTLFKHLEKAPNATWEIVYKDGELNNEVVTGDILKVTGGDGTTVKEYYIKTDDYEASDNLNLAAIVWPDKSYPFLEGWMGDTIPKFQNSGTSYTIVLPPNAKAVPVLVATPEDLNAKIKVDRAVSLSGGIEQRTTTFIVTSESDTLEREVNVLFEVENPNKQLFVGDLLISKILSRIWWNGGMLEIFNPSDVEMDMSQYFIVRSGSDVTTPAGAIEELNATDSTTWLNRYMKYIPGYKWQTYDNWQIEPGLLELDNSVETIIAPGDVFVWWKGHPKGRKADIERYLLERGDMLINDDEDLPGVYDNPWNEPLAKYNTITYPLWPNSGEIRSAYWLFKIVNDSVTKLGSKPAYDINDFELVDCIGSSQVGPWMIGGVETKNGSFKVERLPHSYEGVTTIGEGLDTEWWADALSKAEMNDAMENLGQHVIDPITEHISTVSSLVYKVGKGYVGDIVIAGVSNAETVAAFIGNLILADEAQVLTVTDAGGTARADGDAVVEGDKLQVVAANGETTTSYTVSVVPLDDNAMLTAKDGSGLEIAITDPTGTVGGFAFGESIREVLENVNVPELAMLNVIDGDDQLVPLQRYNNDTLYVDVAASMDHYFEVVAQSGKTIVYQLTPAAAATDAYVLSDVYGVAEEPGKIISLVTMGTGVETFMGNIVPVEGAMVKIMTVSGQQRTTGQLSTDDVLVVTSSDASVTVTYVINFIGELAAYVTSEVFTVDQGTMMITIPDNTTVEALLAGLSPAPSAAMMVKDADGGEKTSGTVLETDMVVVTSGDAQVTASYGITILVSVYNDMADQLRVYPNPAQSVLYVENIPMNTYVRISDITGRTLSLSQAFDVASGIDLSDMRTGIYFLTIEKDGKKQATVKFIKK